MPYLATDKDGSEAVFATEPIRMNGYWDSRFVNSHHVDLPSGTIKKITGKSLSWDDEPIKI